MKGWVVSERVQYEQEILKNESIFGVVVRPAFVFGKKSRHFIHYFDQAKKGKVVVAGSHDIGWSEIHIDDLIDGYLIITESPPYRVGSQIFNFSDGSRFSNVQIAQKFATVAGFNGTIEVDEKLGREFSNKTIYVDNQKAQRILGWRPRHKLLLDQVELLYRTWLAKKTQTQSFTSPTVTTTKEKKEEKNSQAQAAAESDD